MFEVGEQSDLFGVPAPRAYTPNPQHVRNRLTTLLAQMKASAEWPWPEAMVDLHKSRTFDYLCGMLPEDEASDWRAQIEGEIVRLDAPAQAAE